MEAFRANGLEDVLNNYTTWLACRVLDQQSQSEATEVESSPGTLSQMAFYTYTTHCDLLPAELTADFYIR